MLTDKQKESLRGLNYFENDSMERPIYFDFQAELDNEGIPLFRSEDEEDADRYGVTVTLEDYPENILIYYQYFIDGFETGIDYVSLSDIPAKVHQYLKNSHDHIIENIFDALSELTFDAKCNSRGDWRAICILEVA